MGVNIREIYNITNVLQGMGLIKKISENHMGWNDEIGNIKDIMLFKDEEN